jgi:hypothetical protein
MSGVIIDNAAAAAAAAESKQYMRKFVLTTPSWATGEQIAALSQNHVSATYLYYDNEIVPNGKKFLVTIIVEEV